MARLSPDGTTEALTADFQEALQSLKDLAFRLRCLPPPPPMPTAREQSFKRDRAHGKQPDRQKYEKNKLYSML